MYFRTPNPFRPHRPDQEQITQLRRTELARMQAFVQHRGCLMEFIERELDDPSAGPCGRCAQCAGEPISPTVDEGLVRAAITYLRRDNQRIEPRKQWPAGGFDGRRGNIAGEHRLQDIVDSRWTLTVCGVRLREAGSGPVYPVALAYAAGGGDLD